MEKVGYYEEGLTLKRGFDIRKRISLKEEGWTSARMFIKNRV